MKKTLVILLILASGAVAFWYWFTSPARREHNVRVEVLPNIMWLDTGLNEKERAVWHHLSEGSELVPLSVLEALTSPSTGKSFLHSMAYYGFLVEDSDPYKLPIGWAAELLELGGRRVPFVGINCAACHTGEFQYQGNTVRIDGAPNLFSLEQFFLDLRDAVGSLRTNTLEAFLFIRRVIRLNHDPKGEGEFLEVTPKALALLESVNESDGLDAQERDCAQFVGDSLHQVFGGTTNRLANDPHLASGSGGSSDTSGSCREIISALLKSGDYLNRRLRSLEVLSKAIDSGVDLGPGRGDSFGIIRELIFTFDGITLDAPVSTPHLFNFGGFRWLHWDGNTQSAMQRNIAQAIALGADYDPATRKSSVLPRNIHRLEMVGHKIRPPKWPERIFGPIDQAKAQRGKALFQQQRCAECHSTEKVYPLAQVGTSPVRATNFAVPVAGLPFSGQLLEFATKAQFVLFQQHSITPEQAKQMEPEQPEWRATQGYIARSLGGIWATAPFLHNGSVPTLYDLLQPATKRPVKFPVGHREYDPKKLGYTTDVSTPVFIVDTSLAGNRNQGHEFGTTLSETEKWDLLEYLKTL